MSVGDRHDLNGYAFVETLHGPNVERACVDCGDRCYAVPEYAEPRCGTCLLAHAGLTVEQREAQRVRRPRWLGRCTSVELCDVLQGREKGNQS